MVSDFCFCFFCFVLFFRRFSIWFFFNLVRIPSWIFGFFFFFSIIFFFFFFAISFLFLQRCIFGAGGLFFPSIGDLNLFIFFFILSIYLSIYLPLSVRSYACSFLFWVCFRVTATIPRAPQSNFGYLGSRQKRDKATNILSPWSEGQILEDWNGLRWLGQWLEGPGFGENEIGGWSPNADLVVRWVILVTWEDDVVYYSFFLCCNLWNKWQKWLWVKL